MKAASWGRGQGGNERRKEKEKKQPRPKRRGDAVEGSMTAKEEGEKEVEESRREERERERERERRGASEVSAWKRGEARIIRMVLSHTRFRVRGCGNGRLRTNQNGPIRSPLSRGIVIRGIKLTRSASREERKE